MYKARDYVTNPRQATITAAPSDFGMAFQEVTFHPQGDASLNLRGWLIERSQSTRVIVLVHGRHENRAAHLDLVRQLWERGFSVLAIDLRGHGDSDPATCTYGIEESRDVAGAVDLLVERGFGPGSIGVLGWSLGGTSALLALSFTDSIGAVVSDSAYADWHPLLARNALRPGLKLAMEIVFDVDLDVVRPDLAIANSSQPVLVIHGERDRAAPVEHAGRLQRAAPDRVEVWRVEDAGHVQAYARHPEEYVARVSAFFERALR